MKKLFLLLAVALGLSAYAEDEFNIVSITRTDGVTETLQLHKDMKMRKTQADELRFEHPQITVMLPVSEIKDLRFGFDANAPLYTGDHEWAQLEETAVGRGLAVTPEGIAAAGELIEAFDLSGRKVAEAYDTLPAEMLPAGAVYVVRIGKTTLKVRR